MENDGDILTCRCTDALAAGESEVDCKYFSMMMSKKYNPKSKTPWFSPACSHPAVLVEDEHGAKHTQYIEDIKSCPDTTGEGKCK